MRLKRVAAELLALAICCAGTACASQPPAAPSSIPATPVASLPEEPEPQTEETEKEEEETAMEHLYVADAAQYRGTVTSAKTGGAGEAAYCLTAFPGSGFAEELLVVFTPESQASFDLATIQEGDHLEIFYSPAGGEGASQKVIAANKLLPAEGVYYNGILVEKGEREDGSVDLVVVPLDTPSESWGDPMRQFVFHTGESTQFRLAPEALKEGALLNIYHKGIATRSLPPQGVALEVRLLESGA